MYGSFQYDLKSRFYGLFSQLPWSLVVTTIILFPIAYYAEPEMRTLIIELTIYWALILSFILLAKDLYAQRILFTFSLQGRGIVVEKNTDTVQQYTWDQLEAVKLIDKKDSLSRRTLESNGVVLKFDDGFELPVFERVSNYDKFSAILARVISKEI